MNISSKNGTRKIERIKERVMASRKQLARYFITGVSGVVLDLATLATFKEFFHLGPVAAVSLNQLVMYNYIFLMNKYWSFGSKGMTHRQIVRFYVIAGANYLVSVVWMWLISGKLGVNYLFARTGNIALSTSWNFLLYKLWVFTD